ncbi:hypothetical protein MRB53_040785 [Persea americana]|nr:hypothetical protein MRB53_040785 [Persea americana]
MWRGSSSGGSGAAERGAGVEEDALGFQGQTLLHGEVADEKGDEVVDVAEERAQSGGVWGVGQEEGGGEGVQEAAVGGGEGFGVAVLVEGWGGGGGCGGGEVWLGAAIQRVKWSQELRMTSPSKKAAVSERRKMAALQVAQTRRMPSWRSRVRAVAAAEGGGRGTGARWITPRGSPPPEIREAEVGAADGDEEVVELDGGEVLELGVAVLAVGGGGGRATGAASLRAVQRNVLLGVGEDGIVVAGVLAVQVQRVPRLPEGLGEFGVFDEQALHGLDRVLEEELSDAVLPRVHPFLGLCDEGDGKVAAIQQEELAETREGGASCRRWGGAAAGHSGTARA